MVIIWDNGIGSCADYNELRSLGPKLSQKKDYVECDNQSLVIAIKKGIARNALGIFYWCLWFFTVLFEIGIIVTRINMRQNSQSAFWGLTERIPHGEPRGLTISNINTFIIVELDCPPAA